MWKKTEFHVQNLLGERSLLDFEVFKRLRWWKDDHKKAMQQIYSPYQTQRLRETLGMHIKDWYNITKFLMMEGNAGFFDALKLNSGFFLEERKMFQQKINSIFLNNEVWEHLDNATIDFELLHWLEALIKAKGQLDVGKPYGQLLLEMPVLKALIDSGIIYLRRYFSVFHVSRRSYLKFATDYVEARKRRMTLTEKIRYMIYKQRNPIVIKSIRAGWRGLHKGVPSDPKFGFEYEINLYHLQEDPEEIAKITPLLFV
eukprot:TRINITY_DN833_c0_g1_i12.p1 TRINITY_DN833_c0_g1~~TRINITY_DN833_c0_g1_i12.p1  ORF type:complete len:257 (+),score=19.88 TRINITY_DN833_c0_g1_i12:230-1000(+)